MSEDPEPIVVGHIDQAAAGMAAGMDDYVSKPIRAAELFAAIERTMTKFTPPALVPESPYPVP